MLQSVISTLLYGAETWSWESDGSITNRYTTHQDPKMDGAATSLFSTEESQLAMLVRCMDAIRLTWVLLE